MYTTRQMLVENSLDVAPETTPDTENTHELYNRARALDLAFTRSERWRLLRKYGQELIVRGNIFCFIRGGKTI